MDESQQWVEFGRWLGEQREEKGLRRREAAKRAKLSEAQWRDLETGRKEAIGGIRLLPNPSRDVLQRVAEVIEVPVDELLARIGRTSPPRPRQGGRDAPRLDEDGSALAAKVKRLSDRDRQVVDRLVDTLLELDEA